MPEPWPHPKTGTFYCRIIVPADLAAKARGERISVPVSGKLHPIKIGTHAKVSLGTKDRPEAKRRFVEAHDAIEKFWLTLRNGPRTLSSMERQALAGEVHREINARHEHEPGKPEQWQDFAGAMDVALELDHDREARIKLLDMLVGDFVDEALSKRGWRITDESHDELLEDIGLAVRDAFKHVEAMAHRDYSMRRYPRLDAPEVAPAKPQDPITFKSIIDDEHAARTRGTGGKIVREKTFTKFRREAASFTNHRGNEDALDVTHDEISSWVHDLQDQGDCPRRVATRRGGR
ncbi:DUF6538 domain-containing protein [Bosea sp. Root381]|uniref:DUF6538 domain-containing protein n=1 Tax=Bosea sp. Root381 TaxID=1736524 RepID=UPI000B1014A3|nr:DUF6538 domain-containing protein [Bosea sp. Root381]